MTNVVNASERFNSKRKDNEFKEGMDTFWKLFGHLNQAELQQLLEVIQRGDEKEYFEFTNPIIMRKAMEDYNK
jgi:hypothetical protein